ncbi:MAG: ASKHA domain-containing protein [Candidatus Bathyarchaeota archaeon]
MKKHVEVLFEPHGCKVGIPLGTTILQAAIKAGVKIRSECGGKGSCGKCRITTDDLEGLGEITQTERKHLSPSEIKSGHRLACQATTRQDTVVFIPFESRIVSGKLQATGMEKPVHLNPSLRKIYVELAQPNLMDSTPDCERVLNHLKKEYGLEELQIDYYVLKQLPDVLRSANWNVTVIVWKNRRVIGVEEGNTIARFYGAAVDVGTSKIALQIIDLTTGRTIGVGQIENPQLVHGEDVMSRISYSISNDDGLEELQKLVIHGINKALDIAVTNTNVDPKNMYEAIIVGNTAMHHFLLGIQPKHLSHSPFVPAIKRSIDATSKEFNIRMNRHALIYFMPVVAGFVGADAIADLLSIGLHEQNRPSLLVDIGTNTEVVIGDSEDILCCSCASGPAFEGGHIKHGVKAIPGAISSIKIDPRTHDVSFETIENADPIGLCGSAVVDIVAEMRKAKIIDQRGKFNTAKGDPHLKTTDHSIEFMLVDRKKSGSDREITFTQADINEVQLAKAAIFSACSILMQKKGLKEVDLNHVFIAGAFGSSINVENAKILGLIPDVQTEKVRFVGNTAVTGAKIALLSKDGRGTAERLAESIRYLELTADPSFNIEFARSLLIPHKDLDRFKSVKEKLNSTL